MTTNKDALEKIFEAALKETEAPIQRPQQARRRHVTPSNLETTAAVNAVLTTPPPEQQTHVAAQGGTATMDRSARTATAKPTEPFEFPKRDQTATRRITKTSQPDAETQPQPTTSTPSASSTPVLDDAASDELGDLLEKKLKKESSSRKRGKFLRFATLILVVGGGITWFVQSEERVDKLKGIVSDVRSATDVNEMAGSYDESLEKVSARSKQIDQANAAMGVSDSSEDLNDPSLDKEMKDMMGGEGKTTGERDRAIQAAFGNRSNGSGVSAGNKPLNKEESFDFK